MFLKIKFILITCLLFYLYISVTCCVWSGYTELSPIFVCKWIQYDLFHSAVIIEGPSTITLELWVKSHSLPFPRTEAVCTSSRHLRQLAYAYVNNGCDLGRQRETCKSDPPSWSLQFSGVLIQKTCTLNL